MPRSSAFEHYDALGAWRARDNGQPVDASGSLALPRGETLTFADGIDFVHQLAASDRVRDCYALHWTRYALGERIEAATPGLEAIQRKFREDDSIEDLLVSIAGSDLFRTGSTADAPGGTPMISRRRLLRLGGLTALGTGSPGGVLHALAQPAASPPRRLVVISHCHGWPYAAWRMRPAGMPESQPWSLDLTSLDESELSAPLAPLYPHRRRLLVLDGLSLATAELDAGGNRHDRGWIHAWTGNNADFSERDTRATSASLDQLVAAHVARPDRLPSLELSVDAALEAGRPIAYNLGGVRLPAENTPLAAWERVFGPASSGDAVGARRRTTLDFAYREYRALASGLDAGGWARMESHFGLVDRLGRRLEGLATLACDAPPRPARRSSSTTGASTPSPTSSPPRSVATSRGWSRSRSARCRRWSSAPATSATRCTRASPTTSTTTRRSTPR